MLVMLAVVRLILVEVLSRYWVDAALSVKCKSACGCK